LGSEGEAKVQKDSSFSDDSVAGIVDYRRHHATILTTTPSCRIEMIIIEIKTTHVFGNFSIRNGDLGDFSARELAEFVHWMHAGAAT
jgi:hypothetical protein